MSVPLIDRCSGALFARWPRLGPWLARCETAALGGAAALPAIRAPVFVCGLARAGSTLLLEILHASGEFASHQYRDYPMLWTPYWWNYILNRLPVPEPAPAERAHGDGLLVSRASPEAFEEVLWQHYFPLRELPADADLLTADTRNPAFEQAYREHLGKLLAVKNRPRYLAKGNGHLPRLAYLQRLFPDARFVIPVREPRAHANSLQRQDARFRAWSARDPAIAGHLRRSGHREFGPDKRAMRMGDAAGVQAIEGDFRAGRERTGFLRQWLSVHAWLLDQLQSNPALARACMLVDHARLCTQPRAQVMAIAGHAGIEQAACESLAQAQSARIHAVTERVTPDSADLAIADSVDAVWRAIQARCLDTST